MLDQNYFFKYFENLKKKLHDVDVENLQRIANKILEIGGNKVIVVGNGGSAAMASHVAVDLTKAAGIRAVNFNEADLITCLANDYGYEKWVSKALEFYSNPGDILILISSSGMSKNMLNAAMSAKELELFTITLSGFSEANSLSSMGQINLWVDSSEYNIVEMTHHVWLLAIVDYIIASR